MDYDIPRCLVNQRGSAEMHYITVNLLCARQFCELRQPVSAFHVYVGYLSRVCWPPFTCMLATFHVYIGHLSRVCCPPFTCMLSTFHVYVGHLSPVCWPHFTCMLATFHVYVGHLSRVCWPPLGHSHIKKPIEELNFRKFKYKSIRVIEGFRRDVDEICALLGCYAASSGDPNL
jgi:hypothetical protein